ncbi:TetR/AcrR family transcriptional regulator [Actomonas aquatica]|uniref:TetR/AcrR family transcriptional regulator n=1 Tax=Actomonas aquatica TaxID=2866162 RepID=A0ABZ1C5P5_9BACT|nr:TetR/AcrR family transcriptional regulator [Opitutus sp. WL0086]WRQ86558.1 TetR/AcrR family transcriptional regulator [Opitutus sp. WL0086]
MPRPTSHPPAATVHSPSRHLPADERRALTVSAVIDLAARRNPEEITTAAIAAEMQLTQGALFRHFPTKEALWQSVMAWVAEQLLATLDKANTPGAALATLEAMFLAHLQFVARHPGVPRLIFAELQRAEDTAAKIAVRSLLGAYATRIRAVIERGQANAEIDPSLNPVVIAPVFIGTIQGLVMQSLLSGKPSQLRSSGPTVFALLRRSLLPSSP